MQRCVWPQNELSIRYHDEEWGVPIHDDHAWFEILTLEGAQAGLSWDTILKKRERYRHVFDQFDPAKVARFSDQKVERLLLDPGIVRNKLKVKSTIDNAKAFLRVQAECGSFDEFLWAFVGGKVTHGQRRSHAEIPARSSQSDALSKELKRRGFRFVGSTICYAMLQAAGVVNDHLTECYRYDELTALNPSS